jgi:hypothetical protein
MLVTHGCGTGRGVRGSRPGRDGPNLSTMLNGERLRAMIRVVMDAVSGHNHSSGWALSSVGEVGHRE